MLLLRPLILIILISLALQTTFASSTSSQSQSIRQNELTSGTTTIPPCNYGSSLKYTSRKSYTVRRSSSNESEDDDSNDDATTNGCQTLPPRSSTGRETPKLEISTLVKDGKELLSLDSSITEAMLILGNTGCGKTTVTQIIAGDLSRLHAVYTAGGRLVIVDDDHRIGLPSTVSKTLVPELVIKQPGTPTTSSSSSSSSQAIYDCPGFDDTRGSAEDVATNFFMNQVTSSLTRIKMLFLVTHSSVISGNDRLDFDLLAKHATTFVRDISKYRNSFGLVVTKVASFGSNGKFIRNEKILAGVISFLTTYNETLHSKLGVGVRGQDEIVAIRNKIAFVDALLEKNGCGHPSRIWFSRSPFDCGMLSESEVIVDTRTHLTELYQGLQYTTPGVDDFAFTLKETTKTQVREKYAKDIHANISNVISKETEDLARSWNNNLGSMRRQERNLTKLSLEASSDVSKLGLVVQSLSRTSNPAQVANILTPFWNHVGGHPLPSNFSEFMSWQGSLLEFFDKAVGARMERPVQNWVRPLQNFLETSVTTMRDWIEWCLQFESHLNSYEFQLHRPPPPTSQEALNNLGNYIEKNVPGMWSKRYSEFVTRVAHDELGRVRDLINFATRPVTITCVPNNPSSPPALVIQGNFIVLRSVLEGGMRGLMDSCRETTTTGGTAVVEVRLFAAHTLFLDENLVLEQADLVAIAPLWVNKQRSSGGKWSVVLGGKAAPSHNLPSAPNGQARIGERGKSGCGGKHGQPGGSMFGVTGSVVTSASASGSIISLQSVGGAGGPGQGGGDGGSGADSENANFTVHIPDQVQVVDGAKVNLFSLGVWTDRYVHYGISGKRGGGGGDGGVPGLGGLPGKSTLLILGQTSPVQVERQETEGPKGVAGKGGAGGVGGQPGQGYICTKSNNLVNPTTESRPPECRATSASTGRGIGTAGRVGRTGVSQLCPTTRLQPRLLQEGNSLRNYKAIFSSTSTSSNPVTMEFIKMLDTNAGILKLINNG